jgi:hypothetical protein
LGQSNSKPAQTARNWHFEIVFRTDPSIYDGRFANNGWLQELPKPLTKVTWDNVAIVSPNSAQQSRRRDQRWRVKGREHYVPLSTSSTNKGERSPRVPMWIMPGQPDGVITVHLGYGRRLAGRVGSGKAGEPVGFDAYKFAHLTSRGSRPACKLRRPVKQYLLATTQLHFNLEDPNFSKEERDIVRSQTLEEFLHGEHHAHEKSEDTSDALSRITTTKPGRERAQLRLGHGDRSEQLRRLQRLHDRLPVGKQHSRRRQEQVVRSREMHWIRVDTYFKGEIRIIPKARTSCRCRACIARTRRASRFVRFTRRCTVPKA